MSAPLVSVIIPAYNAAEFIGATLQALLAQEFTAWEAVVVDDGSTDRTAEVVRAVRDPRVRYCYQANASQAIARNRGCELTSAPLLAFLDADDWWRADKLRLQVPLFDDPAIGLAHTGYTCMDRQGRPAAPLPPAARLQGDIYPDLLVNNELACSSVMVRRTLLTTHGLAFRAGRQGCEDWDLWLRVAPLTKVACLPAPLLHYRVWPGSVSSNAEVMFASSQVVLGEAATAITQAPELSPRQRAQYLHLLRRGRALQLLRYGRQLLAHGQRAAARAPLRAAFRTDPWQLRTWWGLWLSHYRP